MIYTEQNRIHCQVKNEMNAIETNFYICNKTSAFNVPEENQWRRNILNAIVVSTFNTAAWNDNKSIVECIVTRVSTV